MTQPNEAPAISAETRKRIEEGLLTWNEPDSEVRTRFEDAQEKLKPLFQPLQNAIAVSERLTERDFSIRINLRDDDQGPTANCPLTSNSLSAPGHHRAG